MPGVERPTSVDHAGALAETLSLDGVASGFFFEAGVLLIKTPLDGHPTVIT